MMRDGAGCAPKHQDSIGKDPPRQRELKVRWLDDRYGSKTEVTLLPRQVRSTLRSRRRQTTRACPKSANERRRMPDAAS
jgi:hypothetical protein